MGQARNRGSREERIEQAKLKRQEAFQRLEKRSLDDIRQEFGIPAGSPFLGYVVHIPESDEFLLDLNETADSINRLWCKSPGRAKRFDDPMAAYDAARPGRDLVVGLFETPDQFFVAEVF